MSQPAVARIESGAVTPRVDTLERLLAACGRGLEVMNRLGDGIDRTDIAELLSVAPNVRARQGADASNALARLRRLAGAGDRRGGGRAPAR